VIEIRDNISLYNSTISNDLITFDRKVTWLDLDTIVKPKVFISYAMEDLSVAKRLYTDMKKKGIAPWLAEENILSGQDWDFAIKKAVKQSGYPLKAGHPINSMT
jgi:hypothetical protein